jgi:hypothetical protein
MRKTGIATAPASPAVAPERLVASLIGLRETVDTARVCTGAPEFQIY